MSFYFAIIGTRDQPLFEHEFGTSRNGLDGLSRFKAAHFSFSSGIVPRIPGYGNDGTSYAPHKYPVDTDYQQSSAAWTRLSSASVNPGLGTKLDPNRPNSNSINNTSTDHDDASVVPVGDGENSDTVPSNSTPSPTCLDTRERSFVRTMLQFIVHASLDAIEELQWQTGSMFLRYVDRHLSNYVFAFVTGGNVKFCLLVNPDTHAYPAPAPQLPLPPPPPFPPPALNGTSDRPTTTLSSVPNPVPVPAPAPVPAPTPAPAPAPVSAPASVSATSLPSPSTSPNPFSALYTTPPPGSVVILPAHDTDPTPTVDDSAPSINTSTSLSSTKPSPLPSYPASSTSATNSSLFASVFSNSPAHAKPSKLPSSSSTIPTSTSSTSEPRSKFLSPLSSLASTTNPDSAPHPLPSASYQPTASSTEEPIKHFFLDVYDAWLKTLMNPFYTPDMSIQNPAFRARVIAAARKYL